MQPCVSSHQHAKRPASASRQLLLTAFAKVDGVALGIAVGLWSGFVISGATAVLVLRGGPVVGPVLSLLGQYFVGFEVTWPGTLVGWAYGFLFGFAIGWSIAALRNGIVGVYLRFVKFQAQLSSVNDYLDHP